MIVAPTLHGVLSNADIRGRILGPLLTVNDDTINKQSWTKNFVKLLHVSAGIRRMAWEFIQQNNIWVQARFVWDAANLVQPLPSSIFHLANYNDHTQRDRVQAILIPELFTPEMIREFHSSIAVTISIGHSQGQGKRVDEAKDETLSVFFAFHQQNFELFIRSLADTVDQWGSMTVEVNHARIYEFPSTIPVVVDQIIPSLDQIREANRVTSTSLLKDPIDPLVDFKKIAQAMMGPREVKSEIRAKLLEFYTRGTESVDRGEYREAYEIFRTGHQAYDAFRQKKGPKPKWGCIENNGIEHAKADINSMASESLNREISARRSMSTEGYAGPRLMAREIKACDLSLAVGLAGFALSTPSLTDDRRFYGHYRRAVAYANLGDFLTELGTVVPKSEHAAILADTVAEWNDAGFCYMKATQDAFYAAHVAGTAGSEAPQELVDAMHALRRQMCGKIGYDADEHLDQMQRAGLARLQLPVLGLWEGDPVLCAKWGPHHMMLLALFRQYEGSRGPNIADLNEALAQRGLRWLFNEGGEVFLDGNVGAQMEPTWVVPDDTREGLLAEGLTGDRFEMARR
jgi:hypothetical protein